VASFATKYAQQAFEQLAEDLQTGVTVSVYNVERVQGYVNAVDSVYVQALKTMAGQKPGTPEHGDCADDPAYALPGMSQGLTSSTARPASDGLSINSIIPDGDVGTLPIYPLRINIDG